MPHSLKAKIKSLCYKGIITDKERDRLITALDSKNVLDKIKERGMKLTVNERNGYCESIHAEYTPTEALIINQAMRRYVDDENENEEDRAIMEQMLAVKPIFVDVERNEDDNN